MKTPISFIAILLFTSLAIAEDSFALKRAKENLLKAYETELKNHTKKGNLDEALKVKKEKEAFESKFILGNNHDDEAAVVKNAKISVSGKDYELSNLMVGSNAFSNRGYVWENIPEYFKGWKYTQTAGGVSSEILVNVESDGPVYVLVTKENLSKSNTHYKSWNTAKNSEASYSDSAKTKMVTLVRNFKRNTKFKLPQESWQGSLLLIPPEK